MPFSNTSTTSPPQTAKNLARMHLKVPETNHQTLISWLQPRKAPRPAVGYRRVMHTSPAIPTMRLLSIGRRHSSPISASPHIPHPRLTDITDPHASKAISRLATASPPTNKPYLYESRRIASESPRCALSHLRRPPGVGEPVSPSPAATTATPRVRRGAPPGISRTDAGSPDGKRRHGVPVFTDEIQVILKDVLRLKDREEQEEKLLTELLNGRVVGGEGKYERVKIMPASARVDASPAWMTTLF